MNDFDYDVYQKKRIASGDRHRKRGSRSKYCGLPSDHMTHAQWKKKNGEVKVMNLNEPMLWDAFKAMPDDLQKEYIQKCVERFDCTMTDLSKMFQVQPCTVSKKLKELELNHLFTTGKRHDRAKAKVFQSWIGSEPSVETHPTSAPPTQTTPFLSKADSFEAAWHGDVDLIEVMQLIYQFANGDPIRLHITASREASHELV